MDWKYKIEYQLFLMKHYIYETQIQGKRNQFNGSEDVDKNQK